MVQIRRPFEVKLYFPISPEVNIIILNPVLLIKVVFGGVMTRLSKSTELLNNNEECARAAEQTPESVKDKALCNNEPSRHGITVIRYSRTPATEEWTAGWRGCGHVLFLSILTESACGNTLLNDALSSR